MISFFFIDRPIFAMVTAIVIVLVGIISALALPITQYPDIVPPTISISATYPGASAKVVSETVASPIEEQVNGVEDMLYMLSRSTNDGSMSLDVTFKLGTDIDFAQVLTQNRVATAEPKLDQAVRQQGVTTKKRSPNFLLIVSLFSPKGALKPLFMSNYATTQIKDEISRIDGVGDVMLLGARDYSMRIWLDPSQLAARNLSASDVVNSLRRQNVQVAAGRIGQPPVPEGQMIQLPINARGRLLTPEQFEDIIVKTGSAGQIVRVRDIGSVELGAVNYNFSSYLDGRPSISIAIFQLPGSNALSVGNAVKNKMKELSGRFPDGLEYGIYYDTTTFVKESVDEVFSTLIAAIVLVFLVVLLFLQNWRTTIIPMIVVPIALIGTFAVMALLGFSLNNLSLFGLVLAIGIVVDDAIVVVENVERCMDQGMSARDATRKTMQEVTGPIVATSLVLIAVFVPTVFITGISGQFYRQFALTIAAGTVISTFNSLTLSPALCALLLKRRTDKQGKTIPVPPLPKIGVAVIAGGLAVWLLGGMVQRLLADALGILVLQSPPGSYVVPAVLFLAAGVAGWFLARVVNALLRAFFAGFNRVLHFVTGGYGRLVSMVMRLSLILLLMYGGLMVINFFGVTHTPTGFIPQQDQGYLIVEGQLPEGASLQRTDAVVDRMSQIAAETPGVAHTVGVSGYSLFNSVTLPNVGGMFVVLEPFEERVGDESLSADGVLAELKKRFAGIQEARVAAFGAPPVPGLGTTGGFKLQVQDRSGAGFEALEEAAQSLAQAGNAQPGLTGLYSPFSANQPQLFIEIFRKKVSRMGVSLGDVFDTLQVYLGSAYVNDFTRFTRNWQVYAQAKGEFRTVSEDIGRLKVPNQEGQMVPLATLTDVREVTGPAVVYRYNMYPAAAVSGTTRPGTSSGQAITIMENVAEEKLPQGMGYEWTDITLQQILAGNTAVYAFAFGTMFVFLVLAAQYESWSLPLAIILIVPMCILASIAGLNIARMDLNIFGQIGLLVLIALAAKNAILIVEFARQRQEEGKDRRDATVEAAKLRLRPILMTSFTFILGVMPLLLGTGAGAEMRNTLGTAVFSGMLGVTLFGLVFTPVFYFVIRGFVERRQRRKAEAETAMQTGVK